MIFLVADSQPLDEDYFLSLGIDHVLLLGVRFEDLLFKHHKEGRANSLHRLRIFCFFDGWRLRLLLEVLGCGWVVLRSSCDYLFILCFYRLQNLRLLDSLLNRR